MAYSCEDIGPGLDQLRLQSDQTFVRYLASLDRPDEHVVCSQQAQALKVSYDDGPDSTVRQSKSVIACLTNYRLLLFPELVEEALIFNSLDMFLLEDLIMLSLPYRCINDAAFRTEDVALHLVSLGTLWLRMKSRSDFAECLCRLYQSVVHFELSVQQIDSDELVKQICSGALHRVLVERRRTVWAVQPLIMTASMLHQSLSNPAPNLIDLSKFSVRFMALSRHILHIFMSQAEVDAYRYIVSTSPSERAQTPDWVEIDINDCLMSTFRLESEVNHDGIQIQCPDGTRHLIMPLTDDSDPVRTLNRWIYTIRDRDLHFINRVQGALIHKDLGYQSRIQQEPIEVSLGKDQSPDPPTERLFKQKTMPTDAELEYEHLQEVPL